MTRKMFLGSLAWSVDGSQLREAFGRYPSLCEATVVLDSATRRSRRFQDDDEWQR